MYLASLRHRMERVAEALNFLACDGIFSPDHLQSRLMALSETERTWYLSKLCNFDPSRFWYFGRAVSWHLQTKALAQDR